MPRCRLQIMERFRLVLRLGGKRGLLDQLALLGDDRFVRCRRLGLAFDFRDRFGLARDFHHGLGVVVLLGSRRGLRLLWLDRRGRLRVVERLLLLIVAIGAASLGADGVAAQLANDGAGYVGLRSWGRRHLGSGMARVMG